VGDEERQWAGGGGQSRAEEVSGVIFQPAGSLRIQKLGRAQQKRGERCCLFYLLYFVWNVYIFVRTYLYIYLLLYFLYSLPQDDWLVWLVWTHHLRSKNNTTTATTTQPFDPLNPITAVRRILPSYQWESVGRLLLRTAASCQDRYFLILQAKLADHDAVPAPYLLVVPGVDGKSRKSSNRGKGSKGKRGKVAGISGVDAGASGTQDDKAVGGSDIDWNSDSDSDSNSDSDGDDDGEGDMLVHFAGAKRKAEQLSTEDAGANKKVAGDSVSTSGASSNSGPTEIIELE